MAEPIRAESRSIDMVRERHIYDVKSVVRVTKAEVEQLVVFAARHYDSKCRSTALKGGMLYGILNQFCGDDPEEEVSVEFSSRDLDLLCKITEPVTNTDIPKVQPYFQFKEWWVDAANELHRINGAPE